MAAEIRIGTAGWSYKDWEGKFYPPGMPVKHDRLKYLADYFDMVELNGTFYRPPKPQHAEKWLRSVAHNPDFIFTAKLYEKFTHNERKWSEADAREFKDGIAPLHEAGKLGALLLQFSWGFRNSEESRKYLATLADAFAEFPLVLEVRHVSWDTAAAFDFMRMKNLNFCTIDQPASRQEVSNEPRATGEIGYIRLHGRNAAAWFKKDAGRDDKYNYLYTPAEISEWAKKARELSAKCKKLFIAANNHFSAQAAANALQLAAALGRAPVSIPESLKAVYPFLETIEK